MVLSLVEFLSKLGSLVLDWISSAKRNAEELKKQYDKTVAETKGDAPASADEQDKTKKLREIDPWLKEKN